MVGAGVAASYAGWVRTVQGDYISAWIIAGIHCVGAAAALSAHPAQAGRPVRCGGIWLNGAMRSRTLGLVVALLFPMLLRGCGDAGDEVAPSTVSATPPIVTGPSFVVLRYDGISTVRAGEAVHEVAGLIEAQWLVNGDLIIATIPPGKRRPTMQVVDPATMEPRGPRRPYIDEWRVTPEGITVVDRTGRDTRITVYSLDLATDREIRVTAADVETDQIGPNAEFAISGQARTLGGATWVQWYVNTEDDTLTDHSLLRVEGGEVREVQRNTAIARVYASTDGAALLLLRQDKGDEDCGGCVVEQNIAELDPRTGEIAGEYGMPEGYTRSWRVLALDKIGDRVVVNFQGRLGALSTWQYDGEWAQVPNTDGVLARWQSAPADGDSRLVIRPRPDNQEGSLYYWPYALVWESDGESEEFVSEADSCWRVDGFKRCGELIVPGSLLPWGATGG